MQIKKVVLISLLNNFPNKNLLYFKGSFLNSLKLFNVFILIVYFCTSSVAQEKIVGHGGPVKGLTISETGFLVSTSFDYSSIIWSIDQMQEVITLNDHIAAVNVAEFSPNQKKLVTAGDDMRVLIYDVKELSKIPKARELGSHLGKVSDLTFSNKGNLMASSGWDGSIIIWDMIKEKKYITTSAGHKGPINSIQFSKDGKYLFSSGYDGTVRKFDIFNNVSKGIVISHGWGINVFYINEEKKSIIYGTTDGAIILKDLNNNKNILKIGDERTPVLTMCLDKNESIIAFGNAKGRVIMISLEDYSLVRDFRAAHGPVWALALNNESTMLYVGGLDDFINQWDLVSYPQPVIMPPGPARRFNPSQLLSNGQKQFARKCSVCHTLEPDGKRRAGPTLHKVFGRIAGTLDGYKYSKALIDSKIIWNEKTIHQLFTEGPDVVLPGTKMPIQRMKSSQDRIDLITFLKEATK